jgi:hypothetical protein
VKVNRRIIAIAAVVLAAAVLAMAHAASPWHRDSRSRAASSSGRATIGKLQSTLLLGRYNGNHWRAETTILGAFPAGEAPQRIYSELNSALDSVNRVVRARRARQGSPAALDAAQASLDLQLWYRRTVEVNVSRFELWARQPELSGGIQAAGRRMAAWPFQTSSESSS